MLNASNFRKDLFNHLEKTIEYNDILKVSTKKGNAVLISESDFDDMIATLEILSNRESLKNITDGLENLDNPDYWADGYEVGFAEL